MNRRSLPTNSNLMKLLNRSQVLKLIRELGPVSQAEIAKMTKLSFPSVVNIITDLCNHEIVFESGYGNSAGGRKPVLYQLNSNYMYVIAIEIDFAQIKTIIVNLDAKSISEYRIDIVPTSGIGIMIEQLYQAVDKVIENSKIDLKNIYGIGISSPGPVDHEKGIVLKAPTLKEWNNIPLRDLIKKRYGLPTFLEKDANAASMGELLFGSASGKENAVNILLNHGIGGGIIIEKGIYRGYHKGAGEIGHGTIDINGPLCDCGNYGCLEAFASGIAIVKKIKKEIEQGTETQFKQKYLELGNELTIDYVIEAAHQGDYLAINTIHGAGRYIAVGVANAINFFSPEILILGGKLAIQYPKIIDIIKYHLKDHILEYFYNNIEIQSSQLGEDAGIIGAASMVIEHLLSFPEHAIVD